MDQSAEIDEYRLIDALKKLDPFCLGRILLALLQGDPHLLPRAIENLSEEDQRELVPETELYKKVNSQDPEDLTVLLANVNYRKLSVEQLTHVLTVVLEHAGEQEDTLAQVFKDLKSDNQELLFRIMAEIAFLFLKRQFKSRWIRKEKGGRNRAMG